MDQSFFLLATGLGKMASSIRLRRRFILGAGSSSLRSATLRCVRTDVVGSSGVTMGDSRDAVTGAGGSRDALSLEPQTHTHQEWLFTALLISYNRGFFLR